MNTTKKELTYGMFPAGTICEVQVLGVHKEPKMMEVARIHKNGPNSYVIESNVMTEHTGYEACHITHVTRIIKRGPGVAVIDNSRERKYRKEFIAQENLWATQNGITKHKNKYATFQIKQLVTSLAVEMSNDSMMFDGHKLVIELEKQGVVRSFNCDSERGEDEYYKMFFVQKKKLRKAIKRLLSKCLISHKQAQKENDKQVEEMYRKEAEEDNLRYEKEHGPYYDTTNDKGFPQTMQSDSKGDFPVCSCCKSIVSENKGNGTQCSDCNSQDLMDCSHDYF